MGGAKKDSSLATTKSQGLAKARNMEQKTTKKNKKSLPGGREGVIPNPVKDVEVIPLFVKERRKESDGGGVF